MSVERRRQMQHYRGRIFNMRGEIRTIEEALRDRILQLNKDVEHLWRLSHDAEVENEQLEQELGAAAKPEGLPKVTE